MTVLIAYRSKYGATARCARILSERITAASTLVDLAADRRPDVTRSDVILIGGSIYGGKIQKEVTGFCERNREALIARHVGLFLCCLSQGEHAEAQLQNAFPPWLLAHAFARSLPGGELRYKSLTAMDRLLVRSVTSARNDLTRLRIDTLDTLADAVNGLGR